MKKELLYEEVISSELRQRLAGQSVAAEQGRQLTNDQLDVIYNNKWFLLFVPEEYGGLQSDLVPALRLEESLARIDGSLGWTVTLCSGAGLFFAYLQNNARQAIFGGQDVCLGGSGQASGTAERSPNGYRVNGHWKYATGAPHLTVFTANCVITENGEPVKQEDGQVLIRSFVFKREEVELHDDWQTFGLIATASQRYAVKDLWVEADRSFKIGDFPTGYSNRLYQYPFLPFAEATIAANTLGMAQHFLLAASGILEDSCLRNTSGVRLQTLRKLLESAAVKHNGLRADFYDAVAESVKKDRRTGNDWCRPVSEKSRLMVKELRKLVFSIYPYLGMQAANPENDVNRVWRDLFTASQHQLLL